MIRTFDILNAKLLIVDDQEANVLLLERMLRAEGYTSVSSTKEPRDVFEMHSENSYDLILLDLKMPGMDGFQVMERLKELEPEGVLPVLVVTAEPGHKLRALRAGARDFVSKPLDLSEVLLRVRNMIESRLLRTKALRLYSEVAAQQKVSDRLLLNVLPRSVAERLKERPEALSEGFEEIIADHFPDATVLFADIVDFAKISAGWSPEGLVTILNEVFTEFDTFAEHRGLEKIRTHGAVYVAVAGLPLPARDHAERAAHMALDMLEAVARFNARRGRTLEIRIGINTGTGIAGVIGKRKFSYDLWGNAMDDAARLVAQGVNGRAQVSESTRRRLGEGFQFEEHGVADLGGKGPMDTWLLTSRKSEAPAETT